MRKRKRNEKTPQKSRQSQEPAKKKNKLTDIIYLSLFDKNKSIYYHSGVVAQKKQRKAKRFYRINLYLGDDIINNSEQEFLLKQIGKNGHNVIFYIDAHSSDDNKFISLPIHPLDQKTHNCPSTEHITTDQFANMIFNWINKTSYEFNIANLTINLIVCNGFGDIKRTVNIQDSIAVQLAKKLHKWEFECIVVGRRGFVGSNDMGGVTTFDSNDVEVQHAVNSKYRVYQEGNLLVFDVCRYPSRDADESKQWQRLQA